MSEHANGLSIEATFAIASRESRTVVNPDGRETARRLLLGGAVGTGRPKS